MHVYKLNRPLFDLPPSHPARALLEAFIECRKECVGREIPWPDGPEPIDQKWYSRIQDKEQTFSGFAYMYLSFTLVLDGWLNDAPTITPSEKAALQQLPILEGLLQECLAAAHRDNNTAVIPLIHQTQNLLKLWRECIEARLEQIK